MAIAALVMAGGRATRMKNRAEKPLLQVGGKPMIQRVIEALKESGAVSRIVVSVTPDTQQTADTARRLGVEVAQTAGVGYEQDMRQAVKTLSLEDIDSAIKNYYSSGKPALMVAAPIELFEKLRMKPSYIFDLSGQQLAPVGLNVINGRQIDETRLDEMVLVAKDEDLVFNVNTPAELESARKRLEH
jgi:adenosylcobinamide-phosphate guanylyltransferase